jgi:membrane-bound lytic murein transglycosylase D
LLASSLSAMKPEELLSMRPKKQVFDEVEHKAVAGRTRSYKVRSGDNLTLIAKANKVDVHDLQRWNQLNGQALKVGQTLVMQDTRKLVAKAGGKKPVQYKVKKGDSLYIVAKRFNVEMQHLKRWNPRTGQALKPGQMLVVSGPR